MSRGGAEFARQENDGQVEISGGGQFGVDTVL